MKDSLQIRIDLAAAISAGMRYLARGVKAPLPDTYEYATVRETYTAALFDAFMGYASGGAVTRWRNAAGKAVIEAVSDAIYRAFDDAGADELDPEDETWLSGKQKEQVGYLSDTFDWLKQARADETITEDAVNAKVERWAQTLDSIYSEALLKAKKNALLEWHYGDTAEHCDTCASLNGTRHRASWYLAHDYIPGKPGAAMVCGGYRCQCWLTDKAGETVTL